VGVESIERDNCSGVYTGRLHRVTKTTGGSFSDGSVSLICIPALFPSELQASDVALSLTGAPSSY